MFSLATEQYLKIYQINNTFFMNKLFSTISIMLLFSTSIWSQEESQQHFANAIIKITATDFNNIPRKGELITLQSIKEKKEFLGITDSSGKLEIIVPKGDNYKVFQRTIKHFVQHGEIEIPNEEGKFTMNLKLELKIFETLIDQSRASYILDIIFFDTGLNITSESLESLENLYHVLQGRPTLQVEIAGHTDNSGSVDANLQLSQERANYIKNYLLNKGIAPWRVDAKGYGSSAPIGNNNTAAGKAQNRRIEIKILKE